jgi:hypothetical protein
MSDCLLEGIPMQPQPATSLAKRRNARHDCRLQRDCGMA